MKNRKMPKNSIVNRLKKLKRSAKERKISVDLNIAYYKDLIDMGCAYCGKDLHEENGYCLDRIENTKGYTFGNVTPCCKVCNRAKGTMLSENFFTWIERAYKHQQKIKELLMKVDISPKQESKIANRVKNSSRFRNAETIEMDGIR